MTTLQLLLESLKYKLQENTEIKLHIKDLGHIKGYEEHLVLQTPMKVAFGYPTYKSHTRHSSKNLFRVYIKEDLSLVSAVLFPAMTPHTKEEYDYYKLRHMIHRIFFLSKIDLTNPHADGIDKLIEFISKKRELPRFNYGLEDHLDIEYGNYVPKHERDKKPDEITEANECNCGYPACSCYDRKTIRPDISEEWAILRSTLELERRLD